MTPEQVKELSELLTAKYMEAHKLGLIEGVDFCIEAIQELILHGGSDAMKACTLLVSLRARVQNEL